MPASNSNNNTRPIRCIAVAIDCSPCSRASLDAAAEMAARLRAELIGIFVEDINLLRMAELPFAEEVRHFTATMEKIDTGQLERLLRLQAREAQQLLQRAAEEFTLPHSFRIMRGMVPEKVMSGAPEADLIVLGRSGRSPSCRKGLGSTARNALNEGKKHVLLMRPGFTVADSPLLVLYDRTEAARLALKTAIGFTGQGSLAHVIITEPEQEAAAECERTAAGMLDAAGIEAEYHHLPFTDSLQLARYIRMIDSGLLVLSDRMHLPSDTLRNLVIDIDYPVLIVRERQGEG